MKLAAATAENIGNAGGASTPSAIILATTAAAEDDAYVGQLLAIGGVSKTITGYDAATRTATVDSSFPSATANQPYKVLFENNGLTGYQLQLTHFSGAIVDSGANNSTDLTIYLPASVVGTNNVGGMLIEVTTGSNPPDTVRINAYDVTTRKCTLQDRLPVQPNNTTQFKIIESQIITGYDADTLTVTLSAALRKASSAGESYSISESRSIVFYNGTTKLARVNKPFSRWVAAGVMYTINPFVRYTALPTETGEITSTIYYNEDGELHVFVGCKGTATFDRNSGESEKVKFVMTGIVARCEEVDLPVASILNLVPSLVVNQDNASDLLLQGYKDVVISKFSAELGNEVMYRNAPGSELVHIKNRLSKMTCTVDKAALSEFDVYQKMQSDSKMPFLFANGKVGRQTVLFFESTQITNQKPSDNDSIRTHDLDLAILPTSTGGTEFKLIFT